MIYRIDIQHFLTHAIDHFTTEEIVHFQYVIISARIKNGMRRSNVVKRNELYPTPEIVATYMEYQDKKILEKMYLDMLHSKKNDNTGNDSYANCIYDTIINPLIKHFDIVIMCDRSENDYVDVLCKYLKDDFEIEVIDLNQLFTTGRVGAIYIDRKAIWDKAVDVRRSTVRETIRSLESSRDGKLRLLGMMDKKAKVKKLKELGIRVNEADMKNLDKLLIDEWVDNDNDDEY